MRGQWDSSRPWLAVAVGGFAGVALEVVCLALGLGGPQVTSAVDGAATTGGAILAGACTALRARDSADPSARRGWLLMAAANAALLTGILISAASIAVLGLSLTYHSPSLADVAYLTGNVLPVAAVIYLGGLGLRGSRLRLLADGGIVAGALLLLSWLTAMRAIYEADRDDPLKYAVAMAYPFSDVVTLVVVLLAVAHIRRLDPALLLVGVGMLCYAVSDSLFATLGLQHPNVLDAGSAAGAVAIAVAARLGRDARPVGQETELAVWQIVVPFVPLVATGVLVLVRLVRQQGLDAISQVLLAAIVALVLVRQLMAVAESRSFAARLRRASAEQRLLIEQAPVGICRLDRDGRVLSVNRALESMLGCRAERLLGTPLLELLRPDERWASLDSLYEAEGGRGDHATLNARAERADGSVVWCSATVGPLRDDDGRPDRWVAVIEDITERKKQADRAATIQRQLLPQTAPAIVGYELAGTCRPAEDVAGDFYDWAASDEWVDVTVADVMGKGMGSALVMAVLYTALRSAPASCSPAERVRLAAGSVRRGESGDGLFATLFLARIDITTGAVRYVDAGHGYCVIRRAGGRLERLATRSLPVGVRDDEVFAEGTARLEAGDSLVVYSDGLVEREERTLELAELTPTPDSPIGASEQVMRLMATMPSRPGDDVTVVVLRRLLAEPARAATPG